MSDKLKGLVEELRGYRMSPEELQEQELRFAFGNAHFENARITPELVAESLRVPEEPGRAGDVAAMR
jgi:hypothetical protein